MSLNLLFFGLSTEMYALDVPEIEAVIRLPKFTLVPRTPSYLLGVFFQRGKLLPLLDLGQRLKLRPPFRSGLLQSSRADRPAVIIAHTTKGELGLLVDHIVRVEKVPKEFLQKDLKQSFFLGTILTEELRAPLLDLEALAP